MERPVEIFFQDVDRSEAVESRIRERIDRLEERHGRLIGCRVHVRGPHRRHRKGKHYEIDIELTTPQEKLAIGRHPGHEGAHEDIYVAIRDAFDAMEKRLLKLKGKRTDRPPRGREHPLQGRIAELHREEEFGEIATTDGRLIYFHSHAVVDGDFEALSVDDPVELVVASGDSEKGPHASTVRPIGEMRYVDQPEKA